MYRHFPIVFSQIKYSTSNEGISTQMLGKGCRKRLHELIQVEAEKMHAWNE